MKVDITILRMVMEYIRKINNTPLEDLEFYENGERVNIDKELLNEFKFTGLNSSHIINFYDHEEDDEKIKEEQEKFHKAISEKIAKKSKNNFKMGELK